MRVYEFCKQHNIASKQAIAWLQEGGFEVSSHMSVLSPDAISFLEKKVTPVVEAKKAGAQEKTGAIKGLPKEEVQKKQAPQEAPAQQKQPEKPSVVVAKEPPVIPEGVSKQKNIQAVAETKVQHQSIQPKISQPVQPERHDLPLKPILLGEFADKIGRTASEIIMLLLKQGKVVTKNQLLDEKTLQYLAPLFDVTLIQPQASAPEQARVRVQEGTVQRPPVVVVIGHVDHGKTSFLDFVRKTRVAAREKGGITQHLGAYEVSTKNGKVVFLDTPGHEAFTHMRKRGLSVADIAILIVAADDGVMPQTVEAIHHAEQAGVPIIVALNKIDKVDAAQIERVKSSLAQYGLLADDWGGQTTIVPISAKTGENIDQLLDMLALQSELMELRARTEGFGQGYVLESKMEKGRGAVAAILLQNGRLKVGDFFVAGDIAGKVSSMMDSEGKRVTDVGPAVPVQISGFDAIAHAGDEFKVLSEAEYRVAKNRSQTAQPSLVELAQRSQDQENSVKVVLRVDTNSSKEALINAISKLSFKHTRVSVIFVGIGNINESDVQLAQTTGSLIYGFGVKTEGGVVHLAQRLHVPLALHYVIYHLIDDITEYVKSLERPEVRIIKTGEAQVRKVFDIKGVGIIAGCYVKEGKIVRGAKAVVFRDQRKIGEGEIDSLQRDKRSMKEVAAGFECAFTVKGCSDFAVDDRIECYTEQVQQPS